MKKTLLQQLDERIARFDLLCHPFYKAWSAGSLTREDLSAYAAEYYPQVAAFPAYLSAFAARLDEGAMRRAVLANLADEEGKDSPSGGGRPHTELWLDFAAGMGADREAVREGTGNAAMTRLTEHFHAAAETAAPEGALAAFYAYESQIPWVAQEKARGLRQWYGADAATCRYFDLHATADVHHAMVWQRLLTQAVGDDPQKAEAALQSAENAARALWAALDGTEAERRARAA